MMQIVCFKWNKPGYRSTFGPEQPNVLARMFARHLKIPHELVCITDDPIGLDANIRYVPLWDTYSKVPNPLGDRHPSCYRRLKLFDGEFARQTIGERFVIIDLDVVLTNDVTPLFDIPDDFKMFKDPTFGTPYNGSIILQTAGARQKVWDEFDPIKSPERSRAKGFVGSDQGWIAACLGRDEKIWGAEDGVYSYPNEVEPKGGGNLPANARIVVFHGRVDPWSPAAQRYPWVRQHYC